MKERSCLFYVRIVIDFISAGLPWCFIFSLGYSRLPSTQSEVVALASIVLCGGGLFAALLGATNAALTYFAKLSAKYTILSLVLMCVSILVIHWAYEFSAHAILSIIVVRFLIWLPGAIFRFIYNWRNPPAYKTLGE